ncbi:hypothetical protein [Maribacter cobaltidurans]
MEILGLDSKVWALLLFGNSFSFTDLVAYTFGFFTVIISENLCIQLK